MVYIWEEVLSMISQKGAFLLFDDDAYGLGLHFSYGEEVIYLNEGFIFMREDLDLTLFND